MANYKKGSSGSDVKKLQNALISAGYDVGSTGADGVYGKNTEAAVKQYQKDNGLVVDGIAGKNTLGALYSSKADTTPTTPTTPSAPVAEAPQTTPTTTPATTPTTEAPKTTTIEPFSYQDFSYQDFSHPDYGESAVVQQAKELLAQHEANKLGEYKPVWQDEADAYLSQYQNRDAFSYDFNSDALYNQYKDMYIQQGQMAMMDAMGQAAAMTGGYGNSYAQTVGQQAYNQQLGQLNEIMPELYGMAYDRYNQEGQDLMNMYGIYMDKEAQEYAKYKDEEDSWYRQLEYLAGQYDSERNYDYNKWLTERNQAYDEYVAGRNLAYDAYSSDRSLAYDEYVNAVNTAYNQERDAVADAQWQATFDEGVRQYEQNRADEAAAAAARASGSGGGDKDKGLTSMSYEQQQKYMNDAERLVAEKGITGLYEIGFMMEAEGYDEAFIYDWIDNEIKILFPDGEPKPQIQPTAKPMSALNTNLYHMYLMNQ